MSEEHHKDISKQKSRFSSLVDICLALLMRLDVTWSRMPANEADVCYEAAAPGWLASVSVSLSAQNCVHLTLTRGGADSAECSQASGMLCWVKLLECFLCPWKCADNFLTNHRDICVLCIAPWALSWGLCVIWVRESWVSVSQHSAKSHELMTVLFVEILPEKECSYDFIIVYVQEKHPLKLKHDFVFLFG